ncbi:TPA: secretin N-terminal domain-containing protein [Pseudomonas aeruginosa]|uniref:type II secretion system protein GspD n=1 Tax=Pseudomonas aeruginosa TaxID=287 RepID=UPI00071BCF83|nr:type II secretion system protein GspD [Pseudomonas aeruginosa]EIU1682818.1 type II secretion system protein GspD [Pseudomonas aeruginosa]EKV4568668.1 type II secretion system protein GspD [Pseudomonas aeruginosa]KSD29666.1 secretin [Pseudomonas aeruginosa]MBI8969302.1 type II secretion system protein GspD [Pseudomonas aeruginosa]MBU8394399.1 type II secretion system protein GspD [Pseudomonas aeruginosa]
MHPCHRPSFAFLRHPLSIVVCLALLEGCSTSSLQFPEPLLAKSERAKATEGVALMSDDGKKAPASMAVPKTEFSGTPTSPRLIVGGVVDRMDKAILDDKKADISLNVEDVQLAAFINEVFGNILGLPFEIESALKEKTDRVTVRLEQPQTAQMVYEVARQVLVNYGVEILHQGDIYRFQIKQVGLSPDEPPILISGEARPSVPIAYRPVFQFVALHSVDPKDVIPWLNSAYEKSGLSVMADGARSGLMLKGMSSIVSQATEAVRLLDQPFMRGRHSLRIDPAFVSAADMAAQLKTLIAAQGYSVGIGEAVGSIMLVPLDSSNGLIVFANDGQLLDLVREWAQQVDRAPMAVAAGIGEEKEGLFFYEARNTRVTELAKSLRALVSGFAGEGAYGITSGLQSSASKRSGSGRRAGDDGAAPAVAPLLQAAGAAALVGGDGANGFLGGLAAGISGSGTIVEDENRNAILFRGAARTWQQMQGLLREMDKPARQVLIEVTVASVSLSDTQELGMEWEMLNGSFNSATSTRSKGSAGKGGFNYVINTAGGNTAAIQAMADNQRVRVLATPRILVKSGEQANINVGRDIPIPTAQVNDDSTTAGSTNLRNEIAYRSTGTILNVAPVVYSDSRVDLTVSQELSDSGGSSGGGKASGGGISAPEISRTSLETSLTLKSGGSVLMGGLIRDNITDSNAGVPLLKDIPGIGFLFGRQKAVKTREEVIMLIQPYVLESDADAREVTEKLRAMLSQTLACSDRPGACRME